MRRFSFPAALILGFSVIIAPSAYGQKEGADVPFIMIESDVEGITEIKGVTDIILTVDKEIFDLCS